MSQYQSLAGQYDVLTQDVPYDKWVDFYERIFKRFNVSPKLIADLGCGTGAITCKMAKKGYEMIGVDGSNEMLSVAIEKSTDLDPMPIYICQKMQNLDLYGTIDVAISSLDSLNYIVNPKNFEKAIQKASLFLNPKGLFLFDMKSENGLRDLNGKVIIKEDEGVFCVWESMFSEKTKMCTHAIEIFTQCDDYTWNRNSELHKERAYSMETIIKTLKASGFSKIYTYVPFKFSKLTGKEDRWFFVAQKP